MARRRGAIAVARHKYSRLPCKGNPEEGKRDQKSHYRPEKAQSHGAGVFMRKQVDPSITDKARNRSIGVRPRDSFANVVSAST